MHKAKGARLIILLIGFFFLLPIIWIFLVSVQPENTAYSGHYQFLPKEISFESYVNTIRENKHGMYDGLFLSFKMCSVSTLLSMLIALAAVYLIKADVISHSKKAHILNVSIGLYFLPPFLILPGIKYLSFVSEYVNPVGLQLFVVDVILGYVVALILFLIIFASTQKSHFEQLLLETGNRFRAFYFAYVSPNFKYMIGVAGITFTTIWSEFFLSNLITSSETAKPFSVILQMASGQYRTDYSVYASGAVLSFLAYIIFIGSIAVLRKGISILTQNR